MDPANLQLQPPAANPAVAAAIQASQHRWLTYGELVELYAFHANHPFPLSTQRLGPDPQVVGLFRYNSWRFRDNYVWTDVNQANRRNCVPVRFADGNMVRYTLARAGNFERRTVHHENFEDAALVQYLQVEGDDQEDEDVEEHNDQEDENEDDEEQGEENVQEQDGSGSEQDGDVDASDSESSSSQSSDPDYVPSSSDPEDLVELEKSMVYGFSALSCWVLPDASCAALGALLMQVLSSGAAKADETVISNMSVAFDRMLLGVEDPYHKSVRKLFDYYQFFNTYIRPLIDFKNSYVENVSVFSELEDKIRQGHNIVLISNHQREADPAVISLLREAQCPYVGENIKCVAGDRVLTDPLCNLFSLGRNLSKKHEPHCRSGSQLIWIAPSGGRDPPNPPNPSTGEWFPAPFDASSVDKIRRRLVEHSGAPGHMYPMSVLCYDIMPPPPKVEKEIGEKSLVGFHGTGLSIAPEISFSDVTAGCNNPNEAKEAYSQALYNSVDEKFKTLNSAINHRRGIEASTSSVSM